MTSESGILRRGFFTSPAVNVMLFHASAEKSEPTCTTARIDYQIYEDDWSADSYLNRMHCAPARVLPELTPVRAEIRSHRQLHFAQSSA